MISEAWLNTVFDILVEECGAPSIMREEFKLSWPDCVEYRFKGLLGNGGKVWATRFPRLPYVTCYTEDRTDRRIEMISAANKRLRDVVEY